MFPESCIYLLEIAKVGVWLKILCDFCAIGIVFENTLMRKRATRSISQPTNKPTNHTVAYSLKSNSVFPFLSLLPIHYFSPSHLISFSTNTLAKPDNTSVQTFPPACVHSSRPPDPPPPTSSPSSSVPRLAAGRTSRGTPH